MIVKIDEELNLVEHNELKQKLASLIGNRIQQFNNTQPPAIRCSSTRLHFEVDAFSNHNDLWVGARYNPEDHSAVKIRFKAGKAVSMEKKPGVVEKDGAAKRAVLALARFCADLLADEEVQKVLNALRPTIAN